MLNLYKNKMVVLLVSVISIVIFVVGFFYQFEVDYSNYKRMLTEGLSPCESCSLGICHVMQGKESKNLPL